MSNWQKLQGKLTSLGVAKPKTQPPAPVVNNDQSEIGQLKAKKKLEREKNVATINSQKLRTIVKSKYIGLDCEMVGLGSKGKESALARCCCVDFDGNILYDKFVRPQGFVTDFRTQWSGVRRKDLRKGEAIPFSQCQQEVAELLKGRILVGHALRNDLDVLMLSHPRHMIRDTAKYKPYMGMRGHHGKMRPRALRELTVQFLGVQIQSGEHNPAEDANSAMQLYRLKMEEWEAELKDRKKQAKDAYMSKQKGVTSTATNNVAGAKGTISTAATASSSSSKSNNNNNDDSDNEDDGKFYQSDSDVESDSEPETNIETKPSKKNKTNEVIVSNKQNNNSNKNHSHNSTNDKRGEKRKATTNMFGEVVSGPKGTSSGGAVLKSIVDIDKEMAAKKFKKH